MNSTPPARDPGAARRLTIVAWLCVGLAIGVGGWFLANPPESGIVAGFYVGLVLLGIIGATSARTKARRHVVPVGPDALALVGGRPVLFLRTFRDDPSGAFQNLVGGHPAEEQLCRVLAPLGPVVALGRPGERLPHLGATRVYVPEERWQQEVRAYMDGAPLVVLRVGETDNFWWEVEEAARRLDPERVVFLAPDDEAQTVAFLERLSPLLPAPLPALAKGYRVGTLGMRGLLWFGPGWAAHWSPWRWPGVWRLNATEPLIPLLTNAIRPVFERLGIPWLPPPVLSVSTAILGLLIGLLGFLIVGILVFE